MLITLEGIVTEDRLVQFSKAWAPMPVTLSGMVAEDRAVQPLKV